MIREKYLSLFILGLLILSSECRKKASKKSASIESSVSISDSSSSSSSSSSSCDCGKKNKVKIKSNGLTVCQVEMSDGTVTELSKCGDSETCSQPVDGVPVVISNVETKFFFCDTPFPSLLDACLINNSMDIEVDRSFICEDNEFCDTETLPYLLPDPCDTTMDVEYYICREEGTDVTDVPQPDYTQFILDKLLGVKKPRGKSSFSYACSKS